MSDFARYTVIVERQLGETDGREYHDGTGINAAEQLAKELQAGWDDAGIAGHFQIAGRRIVDSQEYPISELGPNRPENAPNFEDDPTQPTVADFLEMATLDEEYVLAIVERKQHGSDCSQDESAAIKRFFDSHDPMWSKFGQFVASVLPLEHAEWDDETEKLQRSDVIYQVPENGNSNRLIVATHWFWQIGDRWMAVVGDWEQNTWWDGADEATMAARPERWMRPIDDRPDHGVLVYVNHAGAEVTEPATGRYIVTDSDSFDDYWAWALSLIHTEGFLYLDDPEGEMVGFLRNSPKMWPPVMSKLNYGLTHEQLESEGFDWRLHRADAGHYATFINRVAHDAEQEVVRHDEQQSRQIVLLHDSERSEVIGFLFAERADEIVKKLNERRI